MSFMKWIPEPTFHLLKSEFVASSSRTVKLPLRTVDYFLRSGNVSRLFPRITRVSLFAGLTRFNAFYLLAADPTHLQKLYIWLATPLRSSHLKFSKKRNKVCFLLSDLDIHIVFLFFR